MTSEEKLRVKALDKAVDIAHNSSNISDRNPEKILELANKIERYFTMGSNSVERK